MHPQATTWGFCMSDKMLSEHFSQEECEVTTSGLPNTIPEDKMPNVLRTLALVELCRALIGGFKWKPTSVWRCKEVNDHAKGSGWLPGQKPSAHMDGRAFDGYPLGFNLNNAFEAIATSDIPFDKLILEGKGRSRWIHIQAAREGEKPQRLTYLGKVDGDGNADYVSVRIPSHA